MVEFCTLEDVRRALDIRTTQQDDWIASLITQARDTIDRYVGYSFQDFPDDVRWLSGRGRDILITGSIRQIKQFKAVQLLTETDFSITEIALSLGYTNSSTFSRAFQRSPGVSPSSYRRSH
ncbi:gp6-like head-tail connector protein [Thermosporothrix hazakensis]|jgi:AraC-like DNA-binding protein|uniref:Gp6-like head-tail connector protein n=1 Tax=Thermosporothrix hazakensis TaxID=644383 RepID=A0A326TZM7_THEHA|nr:helix-turn-helix domain-containing protein [Thermosporothrix hazakensis]PZW18058.1 gp6-like head-tail connector protein [Thermosporothrix hazakensis]GCE46246.1 hypothetical protein KTH_11150 [Thermosporothrix hazakensis]